jgi:8-oxo-dGTP diphosphatase
VSELREVAESMQESRKWALAKALRVRPLTSLLGLSVRLLVPRQRVGVALVGFNKDFEILMLRHVFHPAYPWGLPGGWLGRNEDPAHCAVRELWEETGLTADLGPVVLVSSEPRPAHIGIAFVGCVRGNQLTLSDEILEAAWFPPATLPGPLQRFVQRAIRAAVAQHAPHLSAEEIG